MKPSREKKKREVKFRRLVPEIMSRAEVAVEFPQGVHESMKPRPRAICVVWVSQVEGENTENHFKLRGGAVEYTKPKHL